mgnify:CR=1 FL=1
MYGQHSDKKKGQIFRGFALEASDLDDVLDTLHRVEGSKHPVTTPHCEGKIEASLKSSRD